MQVKTTAMYHFTPTRMAVIKKNRNNWVSNDVKKLELSYIAGGNVKSCNTVENNI